MHIPGTASAVRFVVRSFVGPYLRWSSRPERAAIGPSGLSLRLPRLFAVLGLPFIGLSAWTLYASFPFGSRAVVGIVIQVFFCLLIAVPGIVLLLEWKNHALAFDRSNFYLTDRYGRIRGIPWSEVVEVSSSGTSALLTVRLRNGQAVKVSQYLLGFITYVEALEHHTGVRLRQRPRPVLWWAK